MRSQSSIIVNEPQVCVEGGLRGRETKSSSALVGEAKTKNTPQPLQILRTMTIPPGSDWSLYRQILKLATTRSQGTFICGGDFNVTLNAKPDSLNGKGDARNIGRRMVHFMDH